MSIKDMLVRGVTMYFVLVTLITIAVSVLGMMFDGDAVLGYKDLLVPIKYALLGALPIAVTYSKTELTMKQTIIRKVIQLVIVEAEIMIVALMSGNIDTGKLSVVFSIGASVFVIFVITNLIGFAGNYRFAKQLSKELADFQSSAE